MPKKPKVSLFEGSAFPDFDHLLSELPGKSWSTAQLIEALTETGLPVTRRQVQYRIRHGLFQPLPDMVGRTFVWRARSVRALFELLRHEALEREARQAEDDFSPGRQGLAKHSPVSLGSCCQIGYTAPCMFEEGASPPHPSTAGGVSQAPGWDGRRTGLCGRERPTEWIGAFYRAEAAQRARRALYVAGNLYQRRQDIDPVE
jgi:hypothetical protein